jgi:hypothetical protein
LKLSGGCAGTEIDKARRKRKRVKFIMVVCTALRPSDVEQEGSRKRQQKKSVSSQVPGKSAPKSRDDKEPTTQILRSMSRKGPSRVEPDTEVDPFGRTVNLTAELANLGYPTSAPMSGTRDVGTQASDHFRLNGAFAPNILMFGLFGVCGVQENVGDKWSRQPANNWPRHPTRY